MSNNFEYIRQSDTAGQPPLHLGHSAGGWRFQFRAHPNLGLVSFQAWKAFMAKEPGRIEDECGRVLSAEEFVRYVDCRQSEVARRRQERWPDSDHKSSEYPGWLDPEGYTFANYEFS